MTIPLLDKTAFPPTEEKLVTLYGISWQQFKGIEAQLKDNRDVRLSYLSRILEIMSPIGEKHEEVKSTLSLLLDAYMKEKGIRFYKRGGYTLEAPGYTSATPDESYSVGTKREIPDIVIEIIVTSGTIDRKELYKPKQVPEVWFWKSNFMQIFRFTGWGEYEEVERSGFLPNLDKALLLRYLGHPDQYNAVNEFVQVIRN